MPPSPHGDLPRLPPGHLPRLRLRDALLQADCRLRLLCAPAGSGKSVLLSECLRQAPAGTQIVHLDLRGQAISAQGLLDRIAAALRLENADAQAIDLHLHKLQRPLWLVLDDYPRMPADELDDLLNTLVLDSPSLVSWWIASRRRPQLQLARLLLDGELFELGPRELAFSECELAELLQRGGHTWPKAQQLDLLQQTRGWCAGIRLRLLGVKPGQPLLADGNAGLLLDYLKHEVLDDLPSDWQLGLFTLAQFPSFDIELCEQLLGVGEGAALLQQLREGGLFIEALTQDGRLLCVQQEVAPVLAEQLPSSMTKALFRKACQWYLGREQVRPALEYALKAGQLDVAASLMQRYTEDRLLRGRDLALLLEWRRELPTELLTSTLRLTLLNAWALLLTGRLDESEVFVTALERNLPQPDARRQRELIAQIKALKGKLAFHRGDPEMSALIAESIVELPARAWSQRLMGQLLQVEQALIDGDFDQAQALNRVAIKQAREHGSLAIESLLALEHAKLLEIRGELLRAETLLSRLYTELTESWGDEPSPMRARTQLLRAGLLLQRGCYRDAESAFASGLREATSCADPAAVWGHLGLAELSALHGDPATAFERIADAERLMQYSHINVSLYQGLLLLSKARLWLSQGRHAQAEKALRGLLAQTTQLPPFGAPDLNVRLHMALLQAQLATEQRGEALEELQAMRGQALQEGRRPLVCEIGFSLAEGLHASGKQGQAKQALLDALALARQMGLASVERAFAQRNPAMMRWAADGGADDSAPAALLSRRELDVLKLIAQGYSNQQIAEVLFISLHTVKTHAQRINFKLGVERRTQAVARAKELGLA